MKTIRCLFAAVVAAIGIIPMQAMGQVPVITAFQGNGLVTWTNVVNTNAIYRMEWASQAGGPWHSFTYQPMNTMDAHDSTSFEAEVPMFYRVVMVTNEPPQGMVWIDGGEVELGQVGVAVPVHTNFVSGFWMDEMEVTKAQWAEVYAWAITNDYIFLSAGAGKASNHPVQMVSWYDSVKWCNARSEMAGLTPCYYTDPAYSTLYKTNYYYSDVMNSWVNWSANGYRLPTEAEWEKAARGGRQRKLFPWGGDTIQHARANYNATNSHAYDTSPTQGYHPAYNDEVPPYTSPVGSFPANGYGLHDMAGNVQEWCWDWDGSYSAASETNSRGPAVGASRVLRGGVWGSSAVYARCAHRFSAAAASEFNSMGFRCVRGP